MRERQTSPGQALRVSVGARNGGRQLAEAGGAVEAVPYKDLGVLTETLLSHFKQVVLQNGLRISRFVLTGLILGVYTRVQFAASRGRTLSHSPNSMAPSVFPIGAADICTRDPEQTARQTELAGRFIFAKAAGSRIAGLPG